MMSVKQITIIIATLAAVLANADARSILMS